MMSWSRGVGQLSVTHLQLSTLFYAADGGTLFQDGSHSRLATPGRLACMQVGRHTTGE